MVSPHLEVDLGKIKSNTKKVVELCHAQKIKVLGVTKGFSAMPQIVKALLGGGVDGLADARMENIIDLRNFGFTDPTTLLRIPRLSNVSNVVQYADTSVNSEIAVVSALAQAAKTMKKQHQIILMVDVGDLREGIMTENALATAAQIINMEGVKLIGIGTNMGCFGGVLPDVNNLSLLTELGMAIENTLGCKLEVISGGGTSSLKQVESSSIPQGINQLRIGEGILLGTDTTNNRKIPWLHQDAFVLRAEVIEVKDKPSVPIGTIGRDAFGNVPQFVDAGIRKRAIVALGKQDVYVEGIIPLADHMIILGASSDHLIVDISDAQQAVQVGDNIEFALTYSGLLSVSTSRYVSKLFKGGDENY